jgi:hypothetical protein
VKNAVRNLPRHACACTANTALKKARAFPVQHQKMCDQHTADALHRSMSFALRAALFRCLRRAENETSPLKPKHFSREL